ncbi:MAG: cupin domain-containing protein [Acidilobus sp.]
MVGKLFGKVSDVKVQDVSSLLPGTVGVYVQWLVTKETGSEKFAMRRFVVKPKGRMPLHNHKYVEAVFIIRGRLSVRIGNDERVVGPGDYLFTSPWEPHSIENPFDDEAEFVCVISYEDDMRLYALEAGINS